MSWEGCTCDGCADKIDPGDEVYCSGCMEKSGVELIDCAGSCGKRIMADKAIRKVEGRMCHTCATVLEHQLARKLSAGLTKATVVS